MQINISNDQVKDLRSLCLKVISSTLNKHDTHDFSSEFWHIFFTSVKPLLDNFKQEGASSEKRSSLFSCFIAMSQSPTLVPLLGREANLISAIFSVLTVRTASDAILSSVLDFIENLLKLDKDLDHEGNDTVKRILEPHVEVLVSSFRDLYQTRREFHRYLLKVHLRLSKVSNYLNAYFPDLASYFPQLCVFGFYYLIVIILEFLLKFSKVLLTSNLLKNSSCGICFDCDSIMCQTAF